MYCWNWDQVFRFRKLRRSRKWRTRSMRPYSTRRSATCWLRGILALLRYTFRSPGTMGYLKCFRDSSRSGGCSSVDEGRYAPEEWGPYESGDKLTAYHVWTVVACGIYPSPEGPLPHYKYNATLRPPRAGRPCRQAGHLVPNPVPTIRQRGDLRLGEYHHLKASVFYRPDGLRQPKALAVPDVQRPDGKPGWAQGPEARRRQRRVKAGVAMGDWSGKCEWHTSLETKGRKRKGRKAPYWLP